SGIADASLVGNAEAIAAGRTIFLTSCMPCHGDKGQGIIGPNLTDKYWLHGNRYNDIVNTIVNGVPDKGMIAWKTALNPQKINQVAAFVMSIRGTNPPNPKPPQGQEYPE
ncbi:MAG TPA: c-type cytochrome, partial [bacterium]